MKVGALRKETFVHFFDKEGNRYVFTVKPNTPVVVDRGVLYFPSGQDSIEIITQFGAMKFNIPISKLNFCRVFRRFLCHGLPFGEVEIFFPDGGRVPYPFSMLL